MFLLAASAGLSALMTSHPFTSPATLLEHRPEATFQLQDLPKTQALAPGDIVVQRDQNDSTDLWRLGATEPDAADARLVPHHIEMQQHRPGLCVVASEGGLRCVQPNPFVTFSLGD